MTGVPGVCDTRVTPITFPQIGGLPCDTIRTMPDNVAVLLARADRPLRPGRQAPRRPLVGNGHPAGAAAAGGDR